MRPDGVSYKQIDDDVIERLQLFNRDMKARQRAATITGVFVTFVLGDPSRCSSWSKRFLNTLVNVSGEYTHCEIVFKFHTGHYVACTIFDNDTVKMEVKNYTDTSKWVKYAINIDSEQAQRAYGFCLGQIGKPFNMTGVVWSFVPLVGSWMAAYYRGDGKTFYCSELVLCALQEAAPAVFKKPQYAAESTTPTVLLNILIQENMIRVNNLEDISGIKLSSAI